MTSILCDASIVLKWFHEQDEPEVEEARELLAAHREGTLTASVLELTFYELGNVLVRSLRWSASDVADQLADLRRLCPVLDAPPDALSLAAELAVANALTFYDAVYAAAAKAHGATLVSADRELLGCGLATSPASTLGGST